MAAGMDREAVGTSFLPQEVGWSRTVRFATMTLSNYSIVEYSQAWRCCSYMAST